MNTGYYFFDAACTSCTNGIGDKNKIGFNLDQIVLEGTNTYDIGSITMNTYAFTEADVDRMSPSNDYNMPGFDFNRPWIRSGIKSIFEVDW